MRKTLAGFTAIGLLFAVPAFAQQDQQNQPGAQQNQQDRTTTPQAGDTQPGQQDTGTQAGDRQPGQQQAQTGRPGQPRAMTPDRVRQVLEDAGFQQIQIIDAAYVIQAQTEDGDTVIMMINPPARAGAGATGTGTDTDRTTGATGTDRPGATGESGQQRGTGATEPNPPQQ